MNKSKDYSQDIIEIDDGMIGIRVDASHIGNMSAVFAALKAAPTPKKKGQ